MANNHQNSAFFEPKKLAFAHLFSLLWSFTRPTNAFGSFVFFSFILFVTRTPYTPFVGLLLFSNSIPLLWFLNTFNDIYDSKSDSINPKKNNIWYGYALEQTDFMRARIIGYCSGFAVLLISCLSRSWPIILITFVGLVLGYLYSVPPARLKERVGFYYIVVGFPLIVFLIIAVELGGTITQKLTLAFISVWFYMVSIAALAESADYESDKKSNHLTTATRFGIRFPAVISCITWLIGTSVSFSIFPLHFKLYAIIVTFVIVFILIKPNKISIASANAGIAFSAIIPILIQVYLVFSG